MVAKVIIALTFCLAACDIINANAIIEESDDLIQKTEDEFLAIQKDWEDHSEEVVQELGKSAEIEGCLPDGQRLKKCLKKWVPCLLEARRKIVGQIRKIREDVCKLRTCAKKPCAEERKKCVIKTRLRINDDLLLLSAALLEAKANLRELRRCLRA